MASPTDKDSRARMLAATSRLVHERGLHGTSLRDVLEASDAPRGSLYHHFPGGKEQLVLEATVRRVERVTEALAALLCEHDPATAVRLYVLAAAEELEDSGWVFGCPVAPLVLDLEPEASPIAELCRDTFARWQAMLRDALAGAGAAEARADALATLIVAAIEGGLLLARARRDLAPLRGIAAELEGSVRAVLEGG